VLREEDIVTETERFGTRTVNSDTFRLLFCFVSAGADTNRADKIGGLHRKKFPISLIVKYTTREIKQSPLIPVQVFLSNGGVGGFEPILRRARFPYVAHVSSQTWMPFCDDPKRSCETVV